MLPTLPFHSTSQQKLIHSNFEAEILSCFLPDWEMVLLDRSQAGAWPWTLLTGSWLYLPDLNSWLNLGPATSLQTLLSMSALGCPGYPLLSWGIGLPFGQQGYKLCSPCYQAQLPAQPSLQEQPALAADDLGIKPAFCTACQLFFSFDHFLIIIPTSADLNKSIKLENWINGVWQQHLILQTNIISVSFSCVIIQAILLENSTAWNGI